MSDDVLARIDATIDGRCACGCGQLLDPRNASAWFADEDCQRRWSWRQSQGTAKPITPPATITAAPRTDPGEGERTSGGQSEAATGLSGDHGIRPLDGDDVAAFAEHLGIQLEPWQRDVLRHAYGETDIVVSATGNAPPPPSGEDIRRMLAEDGTPLDAVRPIALIKMHPDAIEQLRAVERPRQRYPWQIDTGLGFPGVPILADPKLPEGHWRALDADDNVIRQHPPAEPPERTVPAGHTGPLPEVPPECCGPDAVPLEPADVHGILTFPDHDERTAREIRDRFVAEQGLPRSAYPIHPYEIEVDGWLADGRRPRPAPRPPWWRRLLDRIRGAR